ncbi:MAG: cyanophycinase [Acidimicrobiaceae bacterium]|nr:cyanophycinase [Acidimicrobiaceae bacterium]
MQGRYGAAVAGPVALVGSGEFLEVMRPIDAGLLAGRPPRAVFLPTAAALDGEDRVRYWLELGTEHFRSLGVEPVPLPVLDRKDADSPELAAAIAGAGLVYLSGGNPGYLADTLRDSAVLEAVLAAHRAGAALAGCSAGACALSAIAEDFRHPDRYSGAGLGVVPQVAVLPHFDRFFKLAPGLAEDLVRRAPAGVTVVGIDEETALVGGPERFEVLGRASVTVLGGPDGSSGVPLREGELLELARNA